MMFRNASRISAVLLIAMMAFWLMACGGGGDDTTPGIDHTVDQGDNQVDPLDIDGPTQYPGYTPPDPPISVVEDPIDPENPIEQNFDFGQNVFSIPLDTNGAGRVIASNFTMGQKIAFIIVNLNPAYLDLYERPTGGYPTLPESSFTIQGDLVTKGASSFSYEELMASTERDLGTDKEYNGMPYTEETQHPYAIYERQEIASGNVPYSAIEPVKTTSAIQKGEIRSFIMQQPIIAPPPIEQGEDEQADPSQYRWPRIYNSQDGRLVAIGAHCLVFLSTEINNGHPDTIQFTEARLNRLAREFDTNIYPIGTSSFGPVTTYEEYSVWRDLDRSIRLSTDDFVDGELELPGRVDDKLQDEQKIIIFLYNGQAGGGFFTWFQPDSEIWTELEEDGYGSEDIERMLGAGSTIYIDADNFPPNDNGWTAAYSVMAHEFQHKLYHDHELPTRRTSYMWFNEGLSQLDIHLCGYTVNSGRIIDWAIDGQLTTFLAHTNESMVTTDGAGTLYQKYPWYNQSQYGNGFLFFLYLYEHYGTDVGKKIYQHATIDGETDFIKLIEHATDEDFQMTFTKFAIANFIDGIYKDNADNLFDPRFQYNTIDLRGTVNLATGTIQLPGVKTDVFPKTGGYPIQSIDRLVLPWCSDYVIFSNGDGRDLEITMYSDPNFRMFMLPVTFDATTNKVDITPGVNINY